MDTWHSLGTPGEHIEVVEYRAEWPHVFEREAAAILAACRPYITEVHHIGSTSVPGLAAKPILDVLPVAAGPAEALEAVPRMKALGYRYRGENGIAGRFYFDRVVDGRTVMHVHMFPAGHLEVRRHLLFRDHLRDHPAVAREYQRLKRELAVRYRDDRRTYTDSKAAFITGVIDAAQRGAGRRRNAAPCRRQSLAPFDTGASIQLVFESPDDAGRMDRHWGICGLGTS